MVNDQKFRFRNRSPKPAISRRNFDASVQWTLHSQPKSDLSGKDVTTVNPGARKLSAQEEQIVTRVHDLGIGDWLNRLSAETLRRYAQSPAGAARMQTGYAWRALQPTLRGLTELETIKLLGALLRYANLDHSEASRLLFSAYMPLSLEHDAFGEFIGFNTLAPLGNPRQSIVLVRQTLRRWCQWMESVAHWNLHESLRHAPREVLEVEKTVILLWPLARHHHWVCRELLTVAGMVLHRPSRWFGKSQNEFAARVRSLGLFWQATSRPALALPEGCSVALRYSHFWLQPGFACCSTAG